MAATLLHFLQLAGLKYYVLLELAVIMAQLAFGSTQALEGAPRRRYYHSCRLFNIPTIS